MFHPGKSENTPAAWSVEKLIKGKMNPNRAVRDGLDTEENECTRQKPFSQAAHHTKAVRKSNKGIIWMSPNRYSTKQGVKG